MKTCFGCAVLSLLTLIAVPYGIAQPGCENGIVRLPAGVNGAITICPAVAVQAPDLARQLAAIQSAMSSQQAQLAQLTRLVKDINRVGGPLGGKRQAELLANVTQRLGDARTVSGAQLQQRATTLSGHFEEVETQISAAQADPAEAAKTKAAIQGETGDAIARLDFDTVTNQLSDIQATVHSIDQRTQQIQGTVDAMQDQQQKAAQAAAEAQQKEQQQNLADPSHFVIVNFAGTGTPPGPGELYIGVNLVVWPSPSLTDARMQIVFSAAGEPHPWVVNPPIPRVIVMAAPVTTFSVPKLGDHAVVCFSAVDPRVGQRRRWREAFVVRFTPVRMPSIPNMTTTPQMAALLAKQALLSFQADSQATLTPDSGAPCQ